MQMLAHGAGVEELPQAGGLCAGIAERVHHGSGRQPEQVAGGIGRAERAAGRGVMPEAVMRRTDRPAATTAGPAPAPHGAVAVLPAHSATLHTATPPPAHPAPPPHTTSRRAARA